MHQRSRLVALGVSLHLSLAKYQSLTWDRCPHSNAQSCARSRLALLSFLLRGAVLYLGSLRTSTVRLCSRERETYARAAHAGRVPCSVHHRCADRECSVDRPLLVLIESFVLCTYLVLDGDHSVCALIVDRDPLVVVLRCWAGTSLHLLHSIISRRTEARCAIRLYPRNLTVD